jgi:hypothetical protein
MTINAVEGEAAPDNSGVRDWARVVQATLIGLGIVGWFAAWLGSPAWALTVGMCWLTLVIEVWGFHAYRQWSLALIREGVGLQCLYWLAVMSGCAWWTVFSIYHAIPLISGTPAQSAAVVAPAYVAFLFLALTIPLHEWAIDRIERAPIKARKPAQPPKTRPKTPPANGYEPARSPPKRAVNGRASLSLVTSAALAATLAQSGLKPRDPAAFERAAMLAQKHPGLTQEEIAEQADVPRQTLGRWMERVPEAFRAAA